MLFDYPELIKVTTWDKNEILIQGKVSINGGENNDAFVLDHSVSDGVIRINAKIKDIDELPQRVTLVRDGQKIMFKDKAALKKYQGEHGQGYDCISFGADIEIELDIKVPANVLTSIQSVYGIVELKNFNGPVTVDATYGGVDASLHERAVGEITAETNYGEIFTNLDAKFAGQWDNGDDFRTYVSAKPGNGPKYSLESKYGNVYIRKETN